MHVPEWIQYNWVEGRIESRAVKQDKITYFEILFPPEDGIKKLIRKNAMLDQRHGEILLNLGVELCVEIATMADWSHFGRWQALAVKIRDLYLHDQSRVYDAFPWAQLTAWYIRSVDIGLRRADAPTEAQSSPEESESSEKGESSEEGEISEDGE